ncbi:MAG TPA: GTPase domain-containing protein, partial [Candidatus Edwardsbacteria bacterium]|nr:GTPase domain-containing protein [Candidatus Edwardsbacteria bacterium]
LRTVPYVLQFNKRDLPTAVGLEEMLRVLRIKGEPYFEAVAVKGNGVFDTLKAVSALVLQSISAKYKR